MTTPENPIASSTEPNLSRGPMIAALVMWEGSGGVTGGIAGYSLSETHAPNSELNRTIETKISQLDTKIDTEEHVITLLKDTRPDTNTAIDALKHTIDDQKDQKQALQQQKEGIPSPEHTNALEFTAGGVVAGLIVAAAAWKIMNRRYKKAQSPQNS